jgi:hypothetical protein
MATLDRGFHEQELLGILRRLPQELAAEVLDFAQFLEFRLSHDTAMPTPAAEVADNQLSAGDERWNALLATEKSESLLAQLVAEAIAEIDAGNTAPITLAPDGELAPG